MTKYKIPNDYYIHIVKFYTICPNYISSTFKVEETDSFVTIQATLAVNGTIVVQSSIDGTDWFDVPNSTITCSPKGLQSYVESQKDLLYRLKASAAVSSVKILI